ncbi:MAG: UDP-3-O-(3-hydroxymyristoyl)glucosamine N-acyltransferase [Akkermansiaceae bacterium]|nr:UDP-3-O-(3-hydroxymyristoyl)glucosamine N-acyltransferase [Akkermansiaceae bacterium]MCF7732285.1 UDP-3-O-(3-hydroxymyristoyl)glucosamine N-acyltransferase [Akkermansiaceae bacterium]
MAAALTLSELACLVGGDIVRAGPCDLITGVAALDSATTADVSFFGNDKYWNQFLATAAGVVIVGRNESGGPEATGLVAADNPSLAFAAVVGHFAATRAAITPGIHPGAWVDAAASINPARSQVHAGAVVMAGARIGDDSEIGPNCVIGEYAVIGNGCRIMANATIRERCVLGNRVFIQPGAVIGSDGYGYELVDGRHQKIDQVGIVEIGDDAEIGANTTIDRARFGKTIIGEGSKIDNLVQIAHNVVIGKHSLIVSQTGISGSARLGDYVIAGGQVGIAGHVNIGDRATMAARTGVTTDLAGDTVYAGKPAQPLRDDLKLQAMVRRLPKLIERVKALEAARDAGQAT